MSQSQSHRYNAAMGRHEQLQRESEAKKEKSPQFTFEFAMTHEEALTVYAQLGSLALRFNDAAADNSRNQPPEVKDHWRDVGEVFRRMAQTIREQCR